MKTEFLTVIQRELLGFPLEDYLWSYYAGGITNGKWSPDELSLMQIAIKV